MKKRFLIVALFTLFLGGIAVAQSQEQPSGKYADVAFAFNRHISKKQRKFAKTVERGAKRQEKQIKKKLKKLNKRIEKMTQLEN